MKYLETLHTERALVEAEIHALSAKLRKLNELIERGVRQNYRSN